MNVKVRINWESYLQEAAVKTMRGYPESAKNYPEIVEISSRNDDGTITVITGHNDFGTPMVVRVDPTSEFVSELVEEDTNTDKWEWVHEGSANFTCTEEDVKRNAAEGNIAIEWGTIDGEEYYFNAADRNDHIAYKIS